MMPTTRRRLVLLALALVLVLVLPHVLQLIALGAWIAEAVRVWLEWERKESK